MLIGTIATLAMTVAATTPQQPPALTLITDATSTLLEQSPDLGTAQFRNVRVVSLPGRHQAVCGEVNGGAGFRRFAYDTVTRSAQAEGSGTFATLWTNCGG